MAANTYGYLPVGGNSNQVWYNGNDLKFGNSRVWGFPNHSIIDVNQQITFSNFTVEDLAPEDADKQLREALKEADKI